MKTQMLVNLIAMTFLSFSPKSVNNYLNHKASQNLADQVVAALQLASSESYVELAPSLDDFKKIIAQNAEMYNGHVAEAQEDFISCYLNNTLPSLRKSFDALLEEGKNRGIDWSNISLVSWETLNLIEAPLLAAPFVIAIESDGKIFRIEITKALYINDHWCVSQYVKLI